MKLEEPTLEDPEVKLPRWIGVLHREQFAHIISVADRSSTIRFTRNCWLKPEDR